MSRHHAGAQAMSRNYLRDEKGTNPALRKLADAIIYNQGFEIEVLARAREGVTREPAVLDLGFTRLAARELGVDGLEHRRPKFIARPPPTGGDLALLPPERISAFDVAFAKGMMIHHQAATDMAWEYNQDPTASNRVLRLLNLDIIREQLYEIGFLGEVGGACGDLGTFVPLVVGGMIVGGLAPAGVLVGFGAFLVAAGLAYGISIAVQPMKAVSASRWRGSDCGWRRRRRGSASSAWPRCWA